jgi:hypothetical protein
MEGPGPSSVAMRVIGTGFEENFGAEAWREREGRADWTEEGRLGTSLEDSFMEEGLLDGPSEEVLEAFRDVARLETETAIWVGLDGRSREATEDVRFEDGPEMEAGFLLAESYCSEGRFGVEVVPALSGEKGPLDAGSGTLTSFSPVDFFDGGGPLIESP